MGGIVINFYVIYFYISDEKYIVVWYDMYASFTSSREICVFIFLLGNLGVRVVSGSIFEAGYGVSSDGDVMGYFGEWW